MRYFCLLVMLFATLALRAQQRDLKLADKAFQGYDFMDARNRYQKLLPEARQHPIVYRRLGDTYYVNSEYREAARYYRRYLKQVQSAQPAVWLRFVTSSGGMEKWASERLAYAKKLDEYLTAKGYTSELAKQIQDTAIGEFEIWKIGFSTKADELGASIRPQTEELYFTARYEGKEHSWSGKAFMDIYTAHQSEDGWELAGSLNNTINQKYHESTPSFSKDGKTMYFTRSVFTDGDVARLKIYRSIWSDSTWQEPKMLPINLNGYSSSHAVESPDGRYLYFASDRPGGLTLENRFIPTSDIWRVSIGENGFGEPEIMEGVNSFGMDTFPFLDADDNLYFASNGRAGMGGLDIYFAKALSDGTFETPRLLAAPLNSTADDFSFFKSVDEKHVFFTSDRSGNDDIYTVSDFRLFECKVGFEVTVVDADTKMPLPDAAISFELGGDFAAETGSVGWTEIDTGITDSLARYDHPVICDARYRISASRSGYKSAQQVFETPGETSDQQRIVLALQPEESIPAVGSDLRKVLDLEPIYFDLDKAFIREDARETLDPIANFLKENPTVHISIESHTDSRGGKEYNQKLSQRRATSTYEYLVANGVAENQLEYIGKGESELVNKCADGVSCSEEAHQDNRRSVFKVIKS